MISRGAQLVPNFCIMVKDAEIRGGGGGVDVVENYRVDLLGLPGPHLVSLLTGGEGGSASWQAPTDKNWKGTEIISSLPAPPTSPGQQGRGGRSLPLRDRLAPCSVLLSSTRRGHQNTVICFHRAR